MASLVSRFFQEWTLGLDPRQGRISIFEHIRDIPYSLVVPITDVTAAPEQILSLGKGYCGPKHYLLAAMFRKLGLDVVYSTFPFLWNDPDLRYPPELRRLAGAMPVAYHLACRVRINGRWILVDATWDRLLAKGGFPINEHWDGFAEMRCAVNPLQFEVRTAYCRTATNEPCRDGRDAELHPLDDEQNHGDEDDHVQYYRKKTGMRTPEQIEQIARFYPTFDAWLESVRGQGA
ncbi:MAG: hypothetical protein WCX22_04405 [Methanoregula sp.]